MAETLTGLLREIRACVHCADVLPHAPAPVLQAGPRARIGVFGQAPGNLAHKTRKPFNDPSGVRLRDWLGVDEAAFYDPDLFFIAPMGFCFPGYNDRGADLPPRKECAELWRARLMAAAPGLETIVLVGAYAQKWHLGAAAQSTLTETVANWRALAPAFYPTPHPSWRNNAWLKKNHWFETDLLPSLRARVRTLLTRDDIRP